MALGHLFSQSLPSFCLKIISLFMGFNGWSLYLCGGGGSGGGVGAAVAVHLNKKAIL